MSRERASPRSVHAHSEPATEAVRLGGPALSAPERVAALQHAAGNRAVARLVVARQPAPAVTDEDLLNALPERAVPILSAEAERQASEHLAAHRRQAAVDVIVDDLAASGRIDAALLRDGRMRVSGAVSGEGVSAPPGFEHDPVTGARVARPTRVRLGPAAFRHGLPFLVTSIMHEYQHVEQFQVGSISVVPGQAPRRSLIRQQDVEAYAWELVHAHETGMAADHGQIRDIWRRLHRNWSRLSTSARRAVAARYRQAHDAAEVILGAGVQPFTPLP